MKRTAPQVATTQEQQREGMSGWQIVLLVLVVLAAFVVLGVDTLLDAAP